MSARIADCCGERRGGRRGTAKVRVSTSPDGTGALISRPQGFASLASVVFAVLPAIPCFRRLGSWGKAIHPPRVSKVPQTAAPRSPQFPQNTPEQKRSPWFWTSCYPSKTRPSPPPRASNSTCDGTIRASPFPVLTIARIPRLLPSTGAARGTGRPGSRDGIQTIGHARQPRNPSSHPVSMGGHGVSRPSSWWDRTVRCTPPSS